MEGHVINCQGGDRWAIMSSDVSGSSDERPAVPKIKSHEYLALLLNFEQCIPG